MRLIKTVAEHDDFSRLALCEHPGWAPLSVLLGLIGCSIPIPLKANILITLAALCKSPEIATQMWNNLEVSQILVTIPTTSSYQPRGIQTELEEVESRMEEYPLTKGMLKLLDVLIDAGIPRMLGAGPRIPGFDPYLTYIINSIFLKFNSRSYKNMAEKWEIAYLCLKLFAKFLARYTPNASDFSNTEKPDQMNASPGFHLMIQLNTKSDVLSLMLLIIHAGIEMLDSYKSYSGDDYINKCSLNCLQILNRSLMIEFSYFKLLSASPLSISLTNLTKLLFTINVRSGQPDHVLNIAKYVCHYKSVPQHSLTAVKILVQLTTSASCHNQFMRILLTSEGLKNEIKIGFMESLDAESLGDENDIMSILKETIFKLLQQCLPYKSPNLSHYLLGFNLKKDISTTVFQLPGVNNFSRSCLHSIFRLLKISLKNESMIEAPLLESVYHILYLLCADNKTSTPTLKLLRMHQDFFKQHASMCYKNMNDGIHHLNQLSWLLSTLAIEMKMSCYTKQINYVKQLTKLLVGVPVERVELTTDEFTLNSIEMRLANPEEVIRTFTNDMSRSTENLLIQIVTRLDFSVKEVVTPQWEFFDESTLNTLLSNCQVEGNPELINVKKLHQILLEELHNVQGTTAIGQRQAILQEIQKVLLHVLNINNSRKSRASIIKFVDAWRQVTEVLITYLPYDVLSAKEQVQLELYILEHLLKRVVKAEAVVLPTIADLFSGVVLLLFKNIQKCYTHSNKQKRIQESETSSTQLNPILNNTYSLKEIGSYLLEWILVPDISVQKLRMNLYGSLNLYLKYLVCNDKEEVNVSNDTFYISKLDDSKLQNSSNRHITGTASDVISPYSEKLINILCQDCVDGQGICQMLAMNNISTVIQLTGNINWILHMSKHGYLKHIIQSILDADKDLKFALDTTTDSLRILYLYESKLTFLMQVAKTRLGSQLLLEQHLLSFLSNMSVFDHHPEISKDWDSYDDVISFMPTIEKRYLDIWLPSLHICSAILTSLGTDNKSVVVQVINFLLSHAEALETILRAGNSNISENSLEELSIVTSIIARTANNDLVALLENVQISQDNRVHLHRIQKLMLALLPKFILTENVIKELLFDPQSEDCRFQTSTRLLHALRIISNVMLYSKNLTASHDVEHGGVGVIFHPTLNESMNNFNGKQLKNFNEHLPSLGIIIQQLLHAVQYFHKEKVRFNFLQGKIKEISHMNVVELKEFMTILPETFDISSGREIVHDFIQKKFVQKSSEIDHCVFIIEVAMYLIWLHLDYYMLKAITKVRNRGSLSNYVTFTSECEY